MKIAIEVLQSGLDEVYWLNREDSEMTRYMLILLIVLLAKNTMSHGGRTNASGCHNDRKSGGYHCHGNRSSYDSPVNLSYPSVNATQKRKNNVYDEVLIVKIQKNLNALGYLVGAEDGILGPRTVTAIKQFQADTSVPVTGLPSYSLYVRSEASLAD